MLRSKSKQVFYVKLDQLVSNSFSTTLLDSRWREFLKWKKSDSSAHFLFDAVDEAKLRRP